VITNDVARTVKAAGEKDQCAPLIFFRLDLL
jgi:hypothetical protein